MLEYDYSLFFIMKKQKIIAVLVCSILAIIVLTRIKFSGEEKVIIVESDISKAECYICGTNERSLMGYFKKFKSIGVWNLSTMDMADTRVRTFTEDGLRETGDNGGTTYDSFDKGNRIMIQSTPERGFSELKITYGNDSQIDFDYIKKYLCQKCLNKVLDVYNEAKRCGSECRNVFLVDFQSLEIYGLAKNITGWMHNDYYVHMDYNDDEDKVLIFYVPQKN